MISDKKLIECLEYCSNETEIQTCNFCIFGTNSECRSLLLSTAAKRIKELNDSLVEAENENRRLKWAVNLEAIIGDEKKVMKKKISTWRDKLIYLLIFIFFVLLILITMELTFGLISGEIPIWMRYVLEQHGGV